MAWLGAGSRGRWPLLIVMAVAITGLGVSVGVPANGDEIEGVDLAEANDVIAVHLRVFDQDSSLLLSTAADDHDVLLDAELTRTDFIAPNLSADKPLEHDLSRGPENVPLGNALAIVDPSGFVGKPLGFMLAGPVAGQIGYEQQMVLERQRGPFNLTMELGQEWADRLSVPEAGETFRLDNLLDAVVMERIGDSAVIEFQVQDGQVLPIRDTAMTARVKLLTAERQFLLIVDGAPGATFSLVDTCRFASHVLPTGSYMISSVNESHINLAMTPIRWPQLLHRGLWATLELDEIRE